MSKQRLVITAVLAGQSQSHVARRYGVSQGWISKLMTRWRLEGEAAFEPRSRRPKTSPTATPPEIVELVIALRQRLENAGLDAGADTIGWHLTHTHRITLNRATIHRILTRHGLVEPEPQKRPKSSYLHFAAEQPNECWQSDFTQTAQQHGYPASTLTDNGMVYTVRLAGGKNSGGRTSLEAELFRRGITQKNGSPHHPQTQGKVERFQQTLKKWLRAQPDQPTTIDQLQQLLDKFADEYNQRRPHRSLEHRATPAAAYTTSIKATPSNNPRDDSHHRVRHDRIDKSGTVSLRVAGHLRHIGVGRTHAGTHVTLLIQELDVTIINATTGEILRELTIDLNRDYQPAGTKK